MRYPLSSPWTANPETSEYINIPGPLAAPGTYRVSLAKRINGQLMSLGEPREFTVTPMRERGLQGATPEEVVAFGLRLDDLNRQVSGAGASIATLLTETSAIKDTMQRSSAPESLREQARTLELELLALQQTLQGNKKRSLYSDEGPVSIAQRLQFAVMGTFRSTYGPTPSHLRSVEIAETDFATVKSRIQSITDSELPDLRRQLDEAGVPWTPGRGVPGRG